MRRSIILAVALALGCTRPPVSFDDEAGVTTNMGEETSAEGKTDEESSSSDESSSTEGPFFVPVFDMPVVSTCDPFEQDCPPGEKCVPSSIGGDVWDVNKCVPVLGEQQPGEPCTYDGLVEGTDDCDATSLCWNVTEIDGELIGTCHAFCLGTADDPECPEDTSCNISSEGSVNVCNQSCDPLVQDCGAGLGCYWANTDFSCIFTTENLPTGEPCGYINDCAPGNLCTTAEVLPDCVGAACCTNFCGLPLGDAQCATQPGTVCTNFFERGMAPPGYEDVGLCVLPF
jgi:hypothetical protein